MHPFDRVVDAVADRSPKFNRFMLKEFVEKSLARSPEFIDETLRLGMDLSNNVVKYTGYRVLDPITRVKRELAMGNSKTYLYLVASELLLVEFNFEYRGQKYHPSPVIYTPYIHQGLLNVRGKRYAIFHGISGQTFTRVKDKKKDGIEVRPIRSPLFFDRRVTYTPVAVDGTTFPMEFGITCKVHWKKKKKIGKRRSEPTVIGYLLAKFGFLGTLEKFGLTGDDVSFVEWPDRTDAAHYYFTASAEPNMGIHLKVRKGIMENSLYSKLVANILYVLNTNDTHKLREMYDEDGYPYMVMLGLLYSPKADRVKAHTEAEAHLPSVDLFIDPITRERFHHFGWTDIDDMYDLMVHLFKHIEEYLINDTAQDMLKKRFDIVDGVLVKAYAPLIVGNSYDTHQKTQLREQEVKRLLRFSPMAIERALNSTNSPDRIIKPSPSIYGDNWLASCGIHKITRSGSSQQRFDPSSAVVVSIMAITGGDLNVTGMVNPFCPIDQYGGVVVPDYYKYIEGLNKYLPKY